MGAAKFVLLTFIILYCVDAEEYKSIEPKCSPYVPADYVKTVAPNIITIVGFQHTLINFDLVDVQDNSFSIRMSVILTWNDTRISKSNLFTSAPSHTVNHELFKSCFWTPQFNAHEIKSMETFHEDLTRPTTLVIVTGKIILFADHKFVIFCRMDMVYFPVDLQSCNLTFLSYHITKTKLKFATTKLDTFRPSRFSDITYNLIQIKEVEGVELEDAVSSRLTINFVFQRRLHLYLMTTYFPSLLATIVSFVSFWIHPDAVPGRVTLGVTCLLALMTQMVSVRSVISGMNYVTSIDIWFLACITFVALSMFEFAWSYTLTRNVKINYMRVNVKNPTKLTKLKWKLLKLSVDQWSRILFPFLTFLFVTCYFVTLTSLVNDKKNQFTK